MRLNREFFVPVSFFLIANVLSSCSLIGEAPPFTQIEREALDSSCEFPSSKELSKPKSTEVYTRALNCTQLKLEDAFDSLKTTTDGELSFKELKRLDQRGVIDLEIEDESVWEAIRLSLRIVHPEGKEAISRTRFKKIIEFMKSKVEIFYQLDHNVEFRDHKPIHASFKSQKHFLGKLIEFFQGALAFISPNFEITEAELLEVHALASDEDIFSRFEDNRRNRDKIRALFLLKNFAFVPEGRLPRSTVHGSSLKILAQMALDAAKKWQESMNPLKRLEYWINGEPLPKEVVVEISEMLLDYFGAHPFERVSVYELQWALTRFHKGDQLVQVLPEFVRLSQRLSPNPTKGDFLDPLGLLQPLKSAGKYVDESTELYQYLAEKCTYENYRPHNCPVHVNTMEDAPKFITDLAHVNFSYSDFGPAIPEPISTRDRAYVRFRKLSYSLFEKEIIRYVFDSFDLNKDGKIVATGKSRRELIEASDLAYAVLRLTTVGSGNLTIDDDEDDPRASESYIVLPAEIDGETVYRGLDILGDQLLPGADQSGDLSRDEFYNAVATYLKIMERGAEFSKQVVAQLPFTTNESGQFFASHDIAKYAPRLEVVKRSSDVISMWYGPTGKNLLDLPEETQHLLWHGLFAIHDHDPMDFDIYDNAGFEDGYSYLGTVEQSIDYVSGTDALTPGVALIHLLDRLMFRCDTNYDNFLDWEELDCALPVIFNISDEILQSSMVKMDPIVNDGVRILFQMFRDSPIAYTIGKLVVLNGSFKNFDSETWLALADAIARHMEEDLNLELEDTIESIEETYEVFSSSPKLVIEFADALRKCDKNGNMNLEATEILCFTAATGQNASTILRTAMNIRAASKSVEKIAKYIEEEKVVELGVALSLSPNDTIRKIFFDIGFEPKVSPTQILQIVAEAATRPVPLVQMNGVYQMMAL